jgi:hypothetical protein
VKIKFISALVATGLLSSPAFAEVVTLDFEGATSFGYVTHYYNGGTDTGGAAGPNYGISFGLDAMALANDELGPYHENAPSPGTVLAATGAVSTMNVANGFAGTASFYYSATAATSVRVFSEVDGGGSLLGTFNLAATPGGCTVASAFCLWELTSLEFAGTAKSLMFGDAAGVAAFDNVTVNAVPLPAAGWLLLSAMGGFGVWRRKQAAA